MVKTGSCILWSGLSGLKGGFGRLMLSTLWSLCIRLWLSSFGSGLWSRVG